MIRADKNETFSIIAALVDELTGDFVSGKIIYYDIRNATDDSILSPTIDGVLTESFVKSGIYRTTVNIPDNGIYICYTTCSGFLTATEEVIINQENIYDLVKQDRYYNVSVEDVERTNATPTLSQAARNVPRYQTDYIVTRIKMDNDVDWNSTTVSGVVYAHYRLITDSLPYMMGDNGL